MLTEEAIRLYAAGKFARACERFVQAADEAPASTARRTDAGRCFETWGWRTLAGGHPDEAVLLFKQGLAHAPNDAALLRGSGVAAVHAGRAADALAPLEAAARLERDAQVHLLLARLSDSRDEPERAVGHLHAVVSAEPEHRSRRLPTRFTRAPIESDFKRDAGPPFGRQVSRRRRSTARRSCSFAAVGPRARSASRASPTSRIVTLRPSAVRQRRPRPPVGDGPLRREDPAPAGRCAAPSP